MKLANEILENKKLEQFGIQSKLKKKGKLQKFRKQNQQIKTKKPKKT